MNDSNNLPIKANAVPPITAISKKIPYKQQKRQHYPGEATRTLLDSLIESETFTYKPKGNIPHKILGKIISRQA